MLPAPALLPDLRPELGTGCVSRHSGAVLLGFILSCGDGSHNHSLLPVLSRRCSRKWTLYAQPGPFWNRGAVAHVVFGELRARIADSIFDVRGFDYLAGHAGESSPHDLDS